MSFNEDIFDRVSLNTDNNKQDIFDKISVNIKPESFVKKAARSLYQPIGGAIEATMPNIAASLLQAASVGEGLSGLEEYDDPRIAELKAKFPQAPWNQFEGIDKEKYLESIGQASKAFPTYSNIEQLIEEKTGVPLTPENTLEKLLRFAGTAGKIASGGLAQKAGAGLTSAAVKGGLEQLGVPESLAEAASLFGGNVPAQALEKVTKPSGAPVRRFEGIKKKTKISPSQGEKIRETIKEDIKTPIQNLIKKESKTARALEADPNFSDKIEKLFDKTKDLVKELPTRNLSTEAVRDSIRELIKQKPKVGISKSETEKAYIDQMKSFYKELTPTKKVYKESSKGKMFKKEIPYEKKITNKELLDQYRKNNQELKKYYEPGKSKGANLGKRNAILDYNRAIANIWENRYPNSEFNKLFKFTNKRQSELYDLSEIDNYFEKVFSDKINFNTAKKALQDTPTARAFERTLGKEGYEEVKQIIKEMQPSEKALKLLREGDALGIPQLLNLGIKFIVPGYGQLAVAKMGVKAIKNSMLTNQKYRFNLNKALKSLNEKKFKKAAFYLNKLDQLG